MGEIFIKVKPEQSFESLLAEIDKIGDNTTWLIVPPNTQAFLNRDRTKLYSDNISHLHKFVNKNFLDMVVIFADYLSHRFAANKFTTPTDFWDGEDCSLNQIFEEIKEKKRQKAKLHQRVLTAAQAEWPANPALAVTRVKLTLQLSLVRPVNISLEDCLLVSLDCVKCLRRHRTVYIYEDATKSYCTPSAYRRQRTTARILDKKVVVENGLTKIVCIFEYPYLPFTDKKLFDVIPLPDYAKSQEMPLWAHIDFSMSCPKCDTVWATVGTQGGSCTCGYMSMNATGQTILLEKIN